MSRIVLSLSGEGRGHAARTLTLLQMLGTSHQVLILAPEKVLDWMQASVGECDNVSLHCLPSLNFRYHPSGKLSYGKSWLAAAPFIYNLRSHLRDLAVAVDQFEPELAIADFEPLLPRVAKTLAIPLLSLDHQHFLSAIDTSILPWPLRLRTLFLRPSVKMFCPSAHCHLVSSFYQYPQRPGTERFQQVGVLLRQEIGSMPSQVADHLLIYVRRSACASWLEILKQTGFECRIYGSDYVGRQGNLDFRPICNKRFIEDLVSCRALFTTAGNQLVGEALAVGKPVFAIPEHGNFEQQINGFFLKRSKMGECVEPKTLRLDIVQNFLAQLDQYRASITQFSALGNEQVMACIHSMLPRVETSSATIKPLKEALT